MDSTDKTRNLDYGVAVIYTGTHVCYCVPMMMNVKATEIQVGDVIRFGGRVERVRVAKRVSVQQEGRRGPVTYKLTDYVQVERGA